MILAWDSAAQVRWSEHVTSDQVATSGTGVTTRDFSTLLLAVRFVMEDLDATPRMQIGVYPERGSALVSLAEIEHAYRDGPHDVAEPDGVA